MKISLVQRRAFPDQYSVEGYFARVVRGLRHLDVEAEQRILPEFSRGFLPRLRNVLATRSICADIVHITGDVHYVAAGADPTKTILTVLDCVNLHRLRGLRRAVFKYLWFTMPVRRCAAITVISEETKRSLLENMPQLAPEKVHVIPVSISELFSFSPKDFQAEKPRILQIGTKANKNLPRTIAALADIPCTLVIVGSLNVDLIQTLRSHKIDYENLCGLTQEQIVEEYQRCDMLAFASTSEGFGMPIVEGQVTGRPVLTSNTSSMPEVAGDGACLVDPFDVASIRRGFLRVIGDSDYRAGLVESGQLNADRFSEGRIARQFHDLYRYILSPEVH